MPLKTNLITIANSAPEISTVLFGLLKLTTGNARSIPRLHEGIYTGVSALDRQGPNEHTYRDMLIRAANAPGIIFPHSHSKIHEWFYDTRCEFDDECFLLRADPVHKGLFKATSIFNKTSFEAPPEMIHGIWVGRGDFEMKIKVHKFNRDDITQFGPTTAEELKKVIIFPQTSKYFQATA